MFVPEDRIYTISDIFRFAENERAELIDGEIIFMAPPKRYHQKLSHFLEYEIENFIRNNNGECEVYSAPFGVFCEEDDKNYFEPDISVICDKSKLTEDGCNGAPDWIIEIVSESSRRMDYITKLNKYSEMGVREYWIVDIKKRAVVVYYFEEYPMPMIFYFTDKVKVNIYDSFEIDFSKIELE